jgi:hypothetical protein
MKRLLLPLLAVIAVFAAPLAVAVETNSTDASSTNGTASLSTNLIVTIDGVTYDHVRFEVASPTTVKIWHSTGIAVVPMANLPQQFQKQLGYDPEKAAEWQLAQQKKRAEQEFAKQEAEIQKHTYSVKFLAASFDSIPNGTIIVVDAFTDGRMDSISSTGAKGFSRFNFSDGQPNRSWYGGICQTGGDVFNELMSLDKTEEFRMVGVKSSYGYSDSPSSDFVVTKVVRVQPQ